MFRTVVAASVIVASMGFPPAFAAAPQPLAAPAAPGICLFSRNGAVAPSRAGQAGTQRLQQLVAGVNAELNPQQQQMVSDNAALQAQKSSLSAGAFQQRNTALEQRFQAFQQLRQLRNAQVQATQTQVEQYIDQAMAPVLDAVSASHRCSVVLDRANAYRFAAGMDLTDQVRVGLDQRLPTVQFNLVAPEAVQPKK